MAELLFIATTIFVAYVVFDVVGRKKDKPETKQPINKTVPKPEPIPVTKKQPTSPQAAKPIAKAAAKPKKASPKKAAAPAAAKTLKNPKTGEAAKVPNNYAFAKRWIKEALVEEGLLDKIYKNNELDADVTAKTREAIHQLAMMDKYS